MFRQIFRRVIARCLIFGLLASATSHLLANQEEPSVPPPAGSAAEVSGKVYHCKPGPWGNLSYYYIFLEAPQDFVDRFPLPNSVTKWIFPGETVEGLRTLFTMAGFPASLQEHLLDENRLKRADNSIAIFPRLADLEAMTPEQREIIYSVLAKADINEFYKNPIFITGSSVEDWLKGTDLRPEIVEKISQFTYKRGEALAFSDLSAVLNYVQSDKEAHALFKTVTRYRTMIVSLKVSRESDIQGVANYWTGRNRYKDILPILSSVAENEEVATIDVIHLLPSMARRYLYTFPALELAFMGRMPDCHWTSLNFFNHWAKQYFLDTRLASSAVLENYDRVSPPYEFGDVLMLMDASTSAAFHSCVYIADDIVFTKNGENLVSPWIFMKLNDVKKIYFASAQRGKVQGFRLKP